MIRLGKILLFILIITILTIITLFTILKVILDEIPFYMVMALFVALTAMIIIMFEIVDDSRKLLFSKDKNH